MRSGSSCGFVDIPGVGRHLAVVQDDAHFIALVDVERGGVDAITLPAEPGGLRQFDTARSNTGDKLYLEARQGREHRRRPGEPAARLLVVDKDDPHAPADLLVVALP